MEGEFRYRGRVITAAEVEFIRQLIAAHPQTNRRQLSLRLCEAWGWKQANGALRDMVCRGLLLELERAGRLALPPARHVHRNPSTRHATDRGKALAPLLLDTTPLEVPLPALRPLEFQQVRRTPEEPLFTTSSPSIIRSVTRGRWVSISSIWCMRRDAPSPAWRGRRSRGI